MLRLAIRCCQVVFFFWCHRDRDCPGLRHILPVAPFMGIEKPPLVEDDAMHDVLKSILPMLGHWPICKPGDDDNLAARAFRAICLPDSIRALHGFRHFDDRRPNPLPHHLNLTFGTHWPHAGPFWSVRTGGGSTGKPLHRRSAESLTLASARQGPCFIQD